MIVGLCDVGGLFALTGCSAVARGQEGAALAASYLPLQVGAVWRYAITAMTVAGERVSSASMESTTEVRTAPRPNIGFAKISSFRTIWSWEERQEERVELEQEEIDDRAGNVIDEESYDSAHHRGRRGADRLAAGAEWPEAFINTAPNAKGHPKSKRAEAKWRVESVTDQVSVPAGTFTCLRLRRAQKHRPPLISWYAKGVGLVKQEGAGPLGDQTLALIATRLP